MKGFGKPLLLPVSVGMIFFLGFESGSFQFALLRVATGFNLGQFAMGLLVTAQFIAIILGPLVFGHIADKTGKKTVLLVFMPVFVTGCVLAALAPNVVVFIFGVFIIGLGFSICECVVSAWLADSAGKNADRYLNLSQSGFGFGAAAGPIVSVWLMDGLGLGWGAVFIASALGFSAVYPFLCLIPKDQAIPSLPGGDRLFVRKLFGNKYFVVLLLTMLIYVGSESGVAFFADSMFTLEYGQGGLSAYAISVFWLAMAISRFVFALVKTKAKTVALVFFSVAIPLFVSLSLITSGAAAIAVIALAGFLAGPVWPTIMGEGTAQFPDRTGTAASAMTIGGGLGGAVVPMLMGLISEVRGIAGAYFLLAFLAALVVVLICVMRR